MKVRWLVLVLLLAVFKMNALVNYADVYPPVIQVLDFKDKFPGDRYGEFIGDDVAILSDGSVWKVHPKAADIFKYWQPGEFVDVGVRTDWYWFKREHKFTLYNHNRKEQVNVMLVRHKEEPLRIVSTDSYFKSTCPVYSYQNVDYIDDYGNIKTRTESHLVGFEPCDERKVLMLNDGSTWVIKDRLRDFQLGMRVYVGAQGVAGSFYDFVLITGDEREAVWTMARPQK